MRKLINKRLIPFILIFIFSLLAGIGFGRKTPNTARSLAATAIIQMVQSSSSDQDTSSNLNQDSSYENKQRNFLIIGVDNLNSPTPRLESVWLILTIPTSPKINLVPIFPSSSGWEVRKNGTNIFNIDPLDSDQALSSDLDNVLSSKGLWWNNYIVLDRFAMTQLIDYARGDQIVSTSTNSDGPDTMVDVPLAWENPHTAFEAQTELTRELCNQAAQIPPSTDIVPLIELIKNHFKSDLNIEQTIEDWKYYSMLEEDITCEFPTLTKEVSLR